MSKSRRLKKGIAVEVEDDVTAYVEYANGASGVFMTSTAEAPGGIGRRSSAIWAA